MRVLIPLDGSPLAEKALAPTAQLLQRAQGPHDVILLRVVRYPSPDIGLMGAYNPFIMNALLADALDASRDYLRQVSHVPALHGVSLTLIAKEGRPASVICEHAHHQHADLIVLTSHGRSALTQVVLGSVAEAVGRQAHIPTLIIREEKTLFPPHDSHEPLTMLVPLDGIALAETALDSAVTFARAFNGTIHLLHVLPTRSGTTAADRELDDKAHLYLSLISDRLQCQDITVARTLAWGDPAEAITTAIQHTHYDLIVMATHGYAGIVRLLEGSVTDDVLHRVQVPILVIHPVADELSHTTPASAEDAAPSA